jgi:hypothetical protein
VAALGVVAYLVFFMSHVPGAKEERFGTFEPLPDDLGQWKSIDAGPAAEAAAREGQRREERLIQPEGSVRHLVKQVRYRSVDTNEIVRVEPEQRVERARRH